MAEYSNPFFGQQNPYQGQQNPFLGRSNPYLTEKIDAAQGDLVRNYNLTTQPAYNTAMAKSGSFGNAGVQQMNENAQLNLQKSLGDVSTNMRGTDYQNQQQLYMQDRSQNMQNYLANRSQDLQNYQWDQGFNRDLFNDAYTQNMGNLQAGVGLLGTMAGYNANDLTNGTNIQNTPLNYWSQFSNSANSIANGFGTTTGTASGGGSNPLMAGLGGAQLGRSLWGSSNWSPNTSTGGSDWANGSGSYSQYNQPDYGQYF
jgi:hypothetical protein